LFFLNSLILKPVYLAFFVLKKIISIGFGVLNLSGAKRFSGGFKAFNAAKPPGIIKKLFFYKTRFLTICFVNGELTLF